MNSIFTIDVEDWFHILDIPSAPKLDKWDKMPSRVEYNFRRLLEILLNRDIKATCFFLGWIAEKYPHLVREAYEQGHEIGSHGYGHKLVYEQNENDFFNDVTKSKKMIENIIGDEVAGYRAPGFSVTSKTPWFFESLSRAGYRYDSSVFPASRGHGGMVVESVAPYRVASTDNSLIEIPISVAKVMGRPFCFFGGGYFRLFPYGLIKMMTGQVLRESGTIVFYIHPREIDPSQPRLKMNAIRKFKSYINLSGTERKLVRLLDDYNWITCREYIERTNIYE